MKLVALISLATIALTVQAQTITYRAPNQHGGSIVLTGDKCTDAKYSDSLHAYTSAKDGSRYTPGCWKFSEDGVVVIWLDDHQPQQYEARGFVRHADGI
jgi:hypothetical protein